MKLPKREGFVGEHIYPRGIPRLAKLSMLWGALRQLVPAIWQERSFSYTVFLAKPLPNGTRVISVLLAINPEECEALARQFYGHYDDTMGQLYLRGHKRG